MSPATSTQASSTPLSDRERYSDPEAPEILQGTLEAIREGGATYRAKLAAKPAKTAG
jgi:hypothetical protein